MRGTLAALARNEDLNFLLANRLPRRLATDLVGRLARIERPLVARTLIGLWSLFCDIELADTEPGPFRSMRDCFTRRLRPGARPIDPDPNVLVGPCDAIVGASGTIEDGQAHQIKGAPYLLADLLGTEADAAAMGGAGYVTLRLTAGMYHRFHAPDDLVVERVTYLAGDCWNVNPIALARIERLFCRNERAAIHCRLASGERIILVAVAAVLVASIRLPFLAGADAGGRGTSRSFATAASFARGDEMGWFEQGSTIVVILPDRYRPTIAGGRIHMGAAIARRLVPPDAPFPSMRPNGRLVSKA